MGSNHSFATRHLGLNEHDISAMLKTINCSSIDALIEQTIPKNILKKRKLAVSNALTEMEMINYFQDLASQNKVYKTYIGQGYYNTFVPPVIQRNILENPGWYTQYTPYQAEISQGRLEALLNFQTMVSDLTGLPLANASLLDEATAAAEAMLMFYNYSRRTKSKKDCLTFFVDEHIFPATKAVLETRAEPFNIELIYGDFTSTKLKENVFGAFIQYPDARGNVADFTAFAKACHAQEALLVVAADILSLTLLKEPGAMGADAVIGTTQRLGVPMGYGGPHAAYFACTQDFKRYIPGRIIGVSVDVNNNAALRMALQTREQHIKRERATSNICTAQALLAIMAGMYAAYHGKEGLQEIAGEIHAKASSLQKVIEQLGPKAITTTFFDTVHFAVSNRNEILERSRESNINLFANANNSVLGFSIDETTTWLDCEEIAFVFTGSRIKMDTNTKCTIPTALQRKSDFLTHPVFSSYRTETEMMRYLKKLENRDLSLTRSMIPLGSCTMKLNAAAQLLPLTWPGFSTIHPYAPKDQVKGYTTLIESLAADLANITGFAATSFQPNSGAQGEYAGLLVIKNYHEAQNEHHRTKMLIPSSAHGTNPASAVMAGMDVVIIKVLENGNIDIQDLEEKAAQHKDHLAGIMVTYPSTNGIFEDTITTVCEITHKFGGLVYMDGANMNAQVGLTSPGEIGADVCHLNLHKTFAIPHGGGGPGMGPICVTAALASFLPNHPVVELPSKVKTTVSAAPFGSASILIISYAYIKMLGPIGLKECSEAAILSANYLADVLGDFYPILYRGEGGRVAHEFIIDLRPFKKTAGIEAEDVAKRLMDYGFHAPTMSWPVPGTIMIEPTESESKAELDRFAEAMISIRNEIQQIENGKLTIEQSPLHHAPHTMANVIVEQWDRVYSRNEAAFPLPYIMVNKFWPSVGRVNNSHGDRNLVCTCPPIEAYETSDA